MSWIAPKIEKSRVKREPAGPEQRLCVTFRYLVTKDAHVTIAASYRISPTLVGRIIKETIGAIWDVLLEKGFLQNLLKVGRTYPNGFKSDGTSPIVLVHWTENMLLYRPLKRVDLYFFNYKNSFNIVLSALCDGFYQFIAVNIGEAGRKNDSRVFSNSNLGRSIVNDYFNLPQSRKLYSEREFLFPYVFVGDDAFPMRHNLLKLFSSSNLERVLFTFNYRLSRARRIIENTFRIFAARFRIFRQLILSCLETVENNSKGLCCSLKLFNGKI